MDLRPFYIYKLCLEHSGQICDPSFTATSQRSKRIFVLLFTCEQGILCSQFELGGPRVKTHQQRREEQRQDKLPSPVQHAGEGHGDGPAGLVEQLGGDEPGDGAGAELIGGDQAENQQDLQAAQLWHQVLRDDKPGSRCTQRRAGEKVPDGDFWLILPGQSRRWW